MVKIVTSPYADDQTLTKEVYKILEEFIEEKWDIQDINKEDVAFSTPGNKILQSGKDITLYAYNLLTTADPWTVDAKRWRYDETIRIDVYVLDNENEGALARDPRAIKIRKWLENLFMIYQENMPYGIWRARIRGADTRSDPFKKNITIATLTVVVTYIKDIVEQ